MQIIESEELRPSYLLSPADLKFAQNICFGCSFAFKKYLTKVETQTPFKVPRWCLSLCVFDEVKQVILERACPFKSPEPIPSDFDLRPAL